MRAGVSGGVKDAVVRGGEAVGGLGAAVEERSAQARAVEDRAGRA